VNLINRGLTPFQQNKNSNKSHATRSAAKALKVGQVSGEVPETAHIVPTLDLLDDDMNESDDDSDYGDETVTDRYMIQSGDSDVGRKGKEVVSLNMGVEDSVVLPSQDTICCSDRRC
jgi:hypothetical protein